MKWIHVALMMALAGGAVAGGAADEGTRADEAAAAGDDVGKPSTYLRAGYQFGTVLATNSFVEGENASGEPINSYHMLRLEFGWQTSGDKDWHHIYNFPSWGLGLNAGDYFNEEELGKPTSLYGFFSWPTKRWGRKSLNFELGFGLTDNWVGFDEVTNPYNVAIGAGRSVYIDVGLLYEFPLAKRWWLQAGFSGTHYSNGGSQQPNWGINQIGALAFVKYDWQDRQLPQVRRHVAPRPDTWETAVTFAGGVRNLALDYRDNQDVPEEIRHYLEKDYAILNLMFTTTRRVSHISAWDCGLDLSFDESVQDLAYVDAFENGGKAEDMSFTDYLGLAAFGGYEHIVHDTRLIVQIGYTFWRKEVAGQVPQLYQRLGLKHHIFDFGFVGLNVRFNDFSRANNLEFNVGYRFGPTD